jgi:hypothetical protein
MAHLTEMTGNRRPSANKCNLSVGPADGSGALSTGRTCCRRAHAPDCHPHRRTPCISGRPAGNTRLQTATVSVETDETNEVVYEPFDDGRSLLTVAYLAGV